MPPQSWVTLIVGGLATVGVIATWQQKNRSDRRSEWWRRTSWAFERTFSENGAQTRVGWSILYALAWSRLATVDDIDIVQVITEHAAIADGGEEDGDADREDS